MTKHHKKEVETAGAEEQNPYAALESLVAEAKGEPQTDGRDQKIADLQKELLYQAAEVENFKRRTEKRYADALKFAAEPLIRDLLPVVDNLERALEHAGNSSESVAEGLGHILAQLRSALSRHGVEEIGAEGAKFDPNFHEALAQVPGEKDGMVASVHEKGYTIHQKLLRPSKVLVTRLA